MQAIQDIYKVNLPIFEGPLDLLLYLIKKNDLDIYEIPLSFITEEYLRYLDAMRELNIDLAGEFLVMAAELARIKSRLLLPQMEAEEEEAGVDPAAELARKLMEYQRFKEVAKALVDRKMLGRDLFKRASDNLPTDIEIPIDSTVDKLINAFSALLKKIPQERMHEITVDRLGISERITQITNLLNEKEAIKMEDLLPEVLTKYDIVITFMALLEMARLRMVQVYQEAHFGSLLLRARSESKTTEATELI